MKYFVLIFTLVINFSYSQILNADQIQKISKVEFEHLDHLIVNEYLFKRMPDIEDENQRVYTNDSNMLDELIVITAIKNPKGCGNILSIVDRSSENVLKLREQLPLEGFVYRGKKRMSDEILVSQFAKEKITISMTDDVTSTGAHQIILVCK
jgi:hypothetical protein